MSKFADQILRFNTMYALNGGVGVATLESSQILDRLRNFQDILSEEMDEAEALEVLINAANAGETDVDFERDASVFEIIKKIRKDHPNASMSQIFAVANADWLGDIIVYCASEMVRYGLDIDKVLNAIMESNFSKLGANGEPTYDSRGKVMKGPNYAPPESMLYSKMFDTKIFPVVGETMYEVMCDSQVFHQTQGTKNRLTIIDGPAGSGKTTLVNSLLKTSNGVGAVGPVTDAQLAGCTDTGKTYLFDELPIEQLDLVKNHFSKHPSVYAVAVIGR